MWEVESESRNGRLAHTRFGNSHATFLLTPSASPIHINSANPCSLTLSTLQHPSYLNPPPRPPSSSQLSSTHSSRLLSSQSVPSLLIHNVDKTLRIDITSHRRARVIRRSALSLISSQPHPRSIRTMEQRRRRESTQRKVPARVLNGRQGALASSHLPFIHSPHHVSRHQVCLVTGGARGLGNEFCKAFIQSGCTSLAIVDLKEDEASSAAEELVKQACGADSHS